MDKPTLGDAHTRLHRLAGQWGGEETVHPAPHDAGGPATAFLNNRIALDGFAVVQEYEQYREGKPTYSGHGVFWFDGAGGEYAMTWFDSMLGMAIEFRGGFDGDVLRLTSALPLGGFLRGTFDIGLPGEYVFVMEYSADGATWTPTTEGAYGLLNGPTPRERQKRVAHRVRAVTGQAAGKTRGVKKAVAKTAVAKKTVAKKAAAKKTTAKKTAATKGQPAAKKAARKPVRKAAPKKKSVPVTASKRAAGRRK